MTTIHKHASSSTSEIQYFGLGFVLKNHWKFLIFVGSILLINNFVVSDYRDLTLVFSSETT